MPGMKASFSLEASRREPDHAGHANIIPPLRVEMPGRKQAEENPITPDTGGRGPGPSRETMKQAEENPITPDTNDLVGFQLAGHGSKQKRTRSRRTLS